MKKHKADWNNHSNSKKGKLSGSKTLWSKLQSIKVQLSIGLLIPVVLLAVYGVVSYKKSEMP